MALITRTTGEAGPTCTGDGYHSWIGAQFKIEIDYNSTKTAYAVKVYACINARGEMHWTGNANLVVECNGVKKTVGVNYRMYDSYPVGEGLGGWDGPVEFEFGAPGDTTLAFSILQIDLTPTTGDNGRPGVYHRGDGGNIQYFTLRNYSIDVSGIPLGEKPTLTSLENNNKYNNPSTGIQNGVSASTTSISIKATVDWGDPTATLHWSCNGKSGTSRSATFTISGLSPGKSYTVSVYLSNDIGNSATRTITIRTRHNSPVVSISLSDVDLEQLVFDWESDKNLKSTEYKIDDGEWTDLGQAGTSGFFTAQWFDPKTTHTIYFRGTSTNTLDALTSSEKNASGTTHDRAHITNIGECIFGLNISLDIESESDKQLQIKIWVEGNGSSPEFIYDNIGTGDITWTFEPTQDQLDQMYRCYPKSNEIPIHFLLTTHGEWKDWDDDQHDKILLLTGIAKTAHFGDSSNKPRRCQVWFGDENNIPRRAVVWTGVDNKARRTI